MERADTQIIAIWQLCKKQLFRSYAGWKIRIPKLRRTLAWNRAPCSLLRWLFWPFSGFRVPFHSRDTLDPTIAVRSKVTQEERHITRPDSSQDCPAFLSHEDNMHLHHDSKLNTALALLRLGGECFGQHGQVTDHAPTFDRQ